MINGLPKKLQELRMLYGYSQKDVATQLGISPSIVSGYETGERTPSTEVLLSISYLYKCSTDYLLGKETSKLVLSIDTTNLTNEQVQAIINLINAIKHE